MMKWVLLLSKTDESNDNDLGMKQLILCQNDTNSGGDDLGMKLICFGQTVETFDNS